MWFEGNQNSQTGTRRDYTSPALEPGYTYALNVKGFSLPCAAYSPDPEA